MASGGAEHALPGWKSLALKSGRPQLVNEEVELVLVAEVSVLAHDKKRVGMDAGVLSVTTHRLLFVSRDGGRASGLSLSEVADVTDRTGLGPKAKLEVRLLAGRPGSRVELKTRKDASTIRTAALGALHRKEWERIAQAEVQRVEKERKDREFSTSRVGIAGIMAKERAREVDRDKTMGAAFADLDSLMNHARELVTIAHKFKGTATGRPGMTVSPSSEAERQQAEIVELLGSLGIASPITKNATGRNTQLYHEQLARQLADFLGRPLDHLGGVMTLIDVYCMYNRARTSTELVSADDLLAACKLFNQLKLPYKLQKLPSGALAVMKGEYGGQASADRLLAMAKKQTSLTALDLVSKYAIPLQIALAQLTDAERRSALCRDERGIGEESGGLRFFPNYFIFGFTT